MRAAIRLGSWLLLLTIGCSGSAGPVQAGEVPLDESGFTAYLSRAFAQAMPGYQVSVAGPLSLMITKGAEPLSRSDLHTIYSFCLRNQTQCDGAVANHVRQMSATYLQPEPPPDRSRLRVVVRQAAYVDAIRRNLAGKGDPVAAPLQGGLWVVCVIDLPDAIQVVTPAHLAKLGLSAEEAISIGKQNSAAALRPLATLVEDRPRGGIGLITGDTYESSRLLFAESWAELAKRMHGKLLVAVPATDVVLYESASRKHAVEELTKAATEVASRANRPVSVAVFRWTPGGWELAAP